VHPNIFDLDVRGSTLSDIFDGRQSRWFFVAVDAAADNHYRLCLICQLDLDFHYLALCLSAHIGCFGLRDADRLSDLLQGLILLLVLRTGQSLLAEARDYAENEKKRENDEEHPNPWARRWKQFDGCA
jgi:hypothetical protein